MTSKQRNRMWLVLALVTGVSIAAVLVFKALGSNMMYFHGPSAIAAGEAPVDQRFRVGGLVVPGSVSRSQESLEVSFSVTDNEANTKIVFSGILPDLFREGQGIIAHGMLKDGVFIADKVLAKHDENYMPPEVADMIKEKNGGVMPFGDGKYGGKDVTHGLKSGDAETGGEQ